MARVAGEIIINRRVEEVFEFVADERNEPRYNPRMVRAEKISEGPVGRGTRFQTELKPSSTSASPIRAAAAVRSR